MSRLQRNWCMGDYNSKWRLHLLYKHCSLIYGHHTCASPTYNYILLLKYKPCSRKRTATHSLWNNKQITNLGLTIFFIRSHLLLRYILRATYFLSSSWYRFVQTIMTETHAKQPLFTCTPSLLRVPDVNKRKYTVVIRRARKRPAPPTYLKQRHKYTLYTKTISTE